MRITAIWVALLVSVCLAPGQQTASELESLKFGAYEHYERGRLEEAVEAFRLYLERRPADLRVKFDLAMLLSELSRDEQAAALLEEIRREEPRHEVAAFRLGVAYVKLKRHEQAREIFEALGESANPDLARAAIEALGRMTEDVSRESRLLEETRVFELAGQGRHGEVVTAVHELESRGDLSWLMEMQRLYALDQMGDLTLALDHANRLALRQPSAVELTLFRADLLSRLGRVPEALALWGKLVREEPGTRAAVEAARRIRESGTGDEPGSEARVYALAARQEHEAVLAAIGAIEQREEPLTPEMRLQRLYSLQVLGRYEEGLREAEVLVERHPEVSEGAWMRAQFLEQLGRRDAAESAYQELVERHSETHAARMAAEWLVQEEVLRSRREVFALSEAGRHEEVVEAVNGLEE
jgi:tetratricopeptide (TPR) repeat protein